MKPAMDDKATRIMWPDTALATNDQLSPNQGERQGKSTPDMLILHYTGMLSAQAAAERLCDPQAAVSSHYLIFENGSIWQLVPETKRAWHAGVSTWQGETDLNSASIGIEIANPGHENGYVPFPQAQIAATIALCRDILTRWPIPSERVLAHSDIAPARKQDPGELFPWEELHRHGIGHWVKPAPLGGGRFLSPGDAGEPVSALQAMLVWYGYGLEISGRYDAATQDVVRAFQRHFRPGLVDGIADASTITTLRDLIAARATA
jgi:N-acetylmuramoyl-L-alanine amidase